MIKYNLISLILVMLHTTFSHSVYCMYEHVPQEKKLQLCHELQNALNPVEVQRANRWWIATKIALSSITGITVNILAQQLDKNIFPVLDPEKANEQLKEYATACEHILKNNTCATIKATLADLPPPTLTPMPAIPTAPVKQQSEISYGQIFTFLTTSALTYALVSSAFDAKKASCKKTVLTFLENWPDYSMSSPQNLAQPVRSLYAAYLQNGSDAVADEKSAQLIILAFNVFLATEIEKLSHSIV